MNDDIKIVPMGTYGYLYGDSITKKCACCGEKFTYFSKQVKYLYSGLQFCSWNCKQKYRKMHYDPNEEMTYAEKVTLREEEKIKKLKNAYKRRK